MSRALGRSCAALAIAAAVAVAWSGVAKSTWAVGGSDSSCYGLMAEAFASGRLQPSSPLARDVPWPDAARTFAPGGFVPSSRARDAFSPVCAPGFSLLLAPFRILGGPDGIFFLSPLSGAVLVWLAFLLGRAWAGPVAGAMAAVVVATSPVVLYQVVQPMNDITTAALWLGMVVAVGDGAPGRMALAGGLCGLALLVRPNLAPLGVIAALWVPLIGGGRHAGRGTWTKGLAIFSGAALPGVAIVAVLNHALYGAAWRSGYGSLEELFGPSAIPTNAASYLRWILETQTPFLFLGVLAPVICGRSTHRRVVHLALGLSLATLGVYLPYRPFDDWSYLRFLLPAIVLMTVLASASIVELAARALGRGGVALVVAITIGLAWFGLRTAEQRLAFSLQALEQRFRSTGMVVRDVLPPGAALLTGWDSGAVRFHAGKEPILWEAMDPAWLDRALAWLTERGRKPYLVVESWEEPAFRARFRGRASIGNLDWPPAFEVDRLVRIYDPADHARYQAGERVVTVYLWPLR